MATKSITAERIEDAESSSTDAATTIEGGGHASAPTIERAEAQALAAAPKLGVDVAEIEDSFPGRYLLRLRQSAARLDELEAKTPLSVAERRELNEIWIALDRFAFTFEVIARKVPAEAWPRCVFVDVADDNGVRFLLAVDEDGTVLLADRSNAPLDEDAYDD